MATLTKLDSNLTSLRFAIESSLGVLPALSSQTWYQLEPNSYNSFGGTIKTVARQTINSGRQIQKGSVVDLDAAGTFSTDVTQAATLQLLLAGFFFADPVQQASTQPLFGSAIPITSVSGTTTNKFNASGNGLTVFGPAGQLFYTSGFTNAGNNGLNVALTINTGYIVSSVALVTESSPPTSPPARLDACGFQFASGDLSLTNSGTAFPTLATSTQDCTAIGLSVGQFVWIGGDSSSTKFATAANNGFARVLSITTHLITLDKTMNTTVTDVGTSKTIQLFYGTYYKNLLGTSIVRTTVCLERILGAWNTAQPTYQEAEYIYGCVANELSFNIPSANKITVDLAFVGINTVQLDANSSQTILSTDSGAGVTLAPLVSLAAYNTSSNIPRINMATYSTSSAFPAQLNSYIQDLSIKLTNNAKGLKAVGTLGSFEVNVGFFQVTGKATAYFAEVAAIQAVQQNNNVTLDISVSASNTGWTLDLPLLTLGGGLADVKLNEPITIPITFDASSGILLNAGLNYTMSFNAYPYLPTAAA
jgi:Phage tail tube protein